MKALFIVGHWNSGTTLLVDVLRKHPELRLQRARWKPNLEDRNIRKILWRLKTDFPEFGEYEDVNENGFLNYPQPDFGAEDYQRFRKLFGKKYNPGQHTLLLKNPWLLFFPKLMAEAFAEDEVKFVFIVRDGRSQVTSKDYWLRSSTPEQHLLNRATFWTRCMEYFQEHWSQKPNMLVLRYENLCTHPEKSIQQVCEHQGLDFAPLAKHMPEAFENRMSKWNKLTDLQKANVQERILSTQQELDRKYKVWGG